MKEILLVGKVCGEFHWIHECLKQRYQVQICSTQYENIASMIDIIKPHMMIMYQNASGEIDAEIFSEIAHNWPKLPVLTICSEDEWYYFRQYCEGKHFYFLERPVKNVVLMLRCESVLAEYGEGEESKSKKQTILVVDDSTLVLRNIREMLGNHFKLLFATTGDKALEIVRQEHVDLILLDYEMPKMNGLQVFQMLKLIDVTAKIPVLFLTGVSDREKIMEVLSQHPAGYILKPLNKNRILEAINGTLRSNE